VRWRFAELGQNLAGKAAPRGSRFAVPVGDTPVIDTSTSTFAAAPATSNLQVCLNKTSSDRSDQPANCRHEGATGAAIK
jgi:hypothetical protein